MAYDYSSEIKHFKAVVIGFCAGNLGFEEVRRARIGLKARTNHFVAVFGRVDGRVWAMIVLMVGIMMRGSFAVVLRGQKGICAMLDIEPPKPIDFKSRAAGDCDAD